MTIQEMAKAIGETPERIRVQLKLGKLKGELRPDSSNPSGRSWVVLSSIEEARTVMAGVRRLKSAPKMRLNRTRALGPVVLPAGRDLFKTPEVAKLLAVSTTTLNKFWRENGIVPLRNGKTAYIPRASVQIAVDYFRKPLPEPVPPVALPALAVSRPDPRIGEVLAKLEAMDGFLRRFAERVGYSE